MGPALKVVHFDRLNGPKFPLTILLFPVPLNERPDEFFFLPEMHGGVDCLFHPVLGDEIQSWRKNLTYEEDKSIYQE